MNPEPCVYIPHYRDGTLYLLKLHFENGKPVVSLDVTWQGAYGHTNSAGKDIAVPPEMFPSMTPESLTGWLLHPPGSFVPDDFPALSKDERVISWCEAVRRL